MIFEIDLRVIDALWFILPAYFANSIPVNVSKIKRLKWLGKPIDGNKEFFGHRIFGDGKTWRGLIFGVGGGTLVGLIQQNIHLDAEVFLRSLLGKGYFILPQMTVELAFILALGALLGDMVASFIKRQSGLKRGDPAPLLDQLDFVFGAVFLSWLLIRSINYERFYVLIIITPVIHVLGNIIAWLLKLKKSPW
ncbi:MAG: CDP-2,3-bis-(O-geranylgeranyl)-sn-glycerol synthase [Candidatus Altiarchaeota archaeon]|nr:CDP-2,3-bis-(O-geranylgeranyl)-sn-glycerol synthase [Candidatus Altiarchaeota archaeon]